MRADDHQQAVRVGRGTGAQPGHQDQEAETPRRQAVRTRGKRQVAGFVLSRGRAGIFAATQARPIDSGYETESRIRQEMPFDKPPYRCGARSGPCSHEVHIRRAGQARRRHRRPDGRRHVSLRPGHDTDPQQLDHGADRGVSHPQVGQARQSGRDAGPVPQLRAYRHGRRPHLPESGRVDVGPHIQCHSPVRVVHRIPQDAGSIREGEWQGHLQIPFQLHTVQPQKPVLQPVRPEQAHPARQHQGIRSNRRAGVVSGRRGGRSIWRRRAPTRSTHRWTTRWPRCAARRSGC